MQGLWLNEVISFLTHLETMQIIVMISTLWRANSIILKIHTLGTFTRMFILTSVCVKIKGDVEKRNIPQLTTMLFYFVDTVTIVVGFFGALCLCLLLPKYMHNLRTIWMSYPENKKAPLNFHISSLSYNHGMVWVEKNLKNHIVPTPHHAQGCRSLEQIA